MNWRPAHEWRGTRNYWWDSPIFEAISLKGLSAKLMWDHLHVFPIELRAANDRDGKRW